MTAVISARAPRRIGVVLFDGFELLDVFGPLEIFGVLPDQFTVSLIGPSAGPVTSSQGPVSVCDYSYDGAPRCDIVLVPGGIGTRRLVSDEDFARWLGAWAADAELVTSVCTGSAVLAVAGLLDGRRATSNKRSFAWVTSTSEAVTWIPEARWVVDGNRWTSSGVAAGIDMALAIVAYLVDDGTAQKVADDVEYEWHLDPSWDPYAAKYGLV